VVPSDKQSSVCPRDLQLLRLAARRDLGHAEKAGFVWRRKYMLYYILTLLEGCCKRVFLTFHPCALAKVYGVRLPTIALLMAINTAVSKIGAVVACISLMLAARVPQRRAVRTL